ncbi:hypothetical protein [Streptomyces sp. NPDC046909]|uniref:hypothetical protein n=1 Tax=Streptomyces sp. NPDC046909 TaxID=3155617 RepID=UPI0033DBF1E9
MSAVLPYLIRRSLFFTAVFGLIAVLGMSVLVIMEAANGSDDLPGTALAAGAVVALVAAFVLVVCLLGGTVHVRRLRRAGWDVTPETVKVGWTADVRLPLGTAEMAAQIPALVNKVPGLRVHWTAPDGLRFRANQPSEAGRGFPHIMGITLTGAKDSTLVTLTSHTLLGLTVFDLGRGYTNMRALVAELQNLSPANSQVTLTGGRIRGMGVLTDGVKDVTGIVERAHW